MFWLSVRPLSAVRSFDLFCFPVKTHHLINLVFFGFFFCLFFFSDYCISFPRFEWNKERCLGDQILVNYLNVVREGSRICIQQMSSSLQAVIFFLLYLELLNKDDLFANELL